MSEEEDSEWFYCRDRFVRTPCHFRAKTEQAILAHQRRIHDPENLRINGGGSLRPSHTHWNEVGLNGEFNQCEH